MNTSTRPFWIYLLIFFVSQLTPALVNMVLMLIPGVQGFNEHQSLLYSLLMANLLGIGLFFLWRPADFTWKRTLDGLRQPLRRFTILAVAMGLPTILLINLVQEQFLDLPNLLDEKVLLALIHSPLGFIVVAFLGPLCEELLFRAGVQGSLQAWSDDRSAMCASQSSLRRFVTHPVFFSSLWFSLIHLNPAQMPAAFCIGLLLGWAYYVSGSIVPSLLIHVTNNTLACLWPASTFSETLGSQLAVILLSLLCACALAFCIFLVRKQR